MNISHIFIRAAFIILLLVLCMPSAALSGGSDDMRGSLLLGYGRVDDANSYTLELDFTFDPLLFGVGFFMIDNGNMPSVIRDYPPEPGVNTIDVGGFRDNETGGYIKAGGIHSGFRAFGMLGGSDVTTKYIVRSTQSGIHYVTEEEKGKFKFLYGAGLGYLILDRVLVQYQHDNRRKGLFMVGLSF